MFVLFFLVVIEENIKYFYCFRKNSFLSSSGIAPRNITWGTKLFCLYFFRLGHFMKDRKVCYHLVVSHLNRIAKC